LRCDGVALGVGAAAGAASSASICCSGVSVVVLAYEVHHEVVVGTVPHDVVFTEGGQTAAVVSDDYLVVLSLSGAWPVPLRVGLSEGLIEPPVAEEVVLSSDGRTALVRQFGIDEISVIDLLKGTRDPLSVGGNPTDLDVTVDGASAVVVCRGSNELWVLDLSNPFAEADVIAMPEGEVFGSVSLSADGQLGVLYSTASGQSRYGVWRRSAGDVVSRSLEKPVSAVGLSPNGGTALMFHDVDNGADVDPESVFYDAYAITMVDLQSLFANPIKLAAEPLSYAHSADGQTGFFVLEDQPYLGVLDYNTIGHDLQQLPSEPVHLGVLPGSNMAFVNQVQPLGRLSFFDADLRGSDQSPLQTITGFELNAAIDNE